MKLSCIVAKGFKNIIKLIIFITCVFISCNKKSIIRNPFLPELDFEFSINLNLPLYNDLKFTGGSLLINDFGHKGVILYNLNNNNYLAWEASCPNHNPNSCSKTKSCNYVKYTRKCMICSTLSGNSNNPSKPSPQ